MCIYTYTHISGFLTYPNSLQRATYVFIFFIFFFTDIVSGLTSCIILISRISNLYLGYTLCVLWYISIYRVISRRIRLTTYNLHINSLDTTFRDKHREPANCLAHIHAHTYTHACIYTHARTRVHCDVCTINQFFLLCVSLLEYNYLPKTLSLTITFIWMLWETKFLNFSLFSFSLRGKQSKISPSMEPMSQN